MVKLNAAMSCRIFLTFLYLGCLSFGGPAAHIGYFRREFVERRRWLDEQQFALQLALCQFLPGPSSSQLGFSIAMLRGGLPGGIAAFIGFTAPSFLLMFALAQWQHHLGDDLLQHGAIIGLKLLAVVVVADAVIAMAMQFCRQSTTRIIALASAAILLVHFSPVMQMLVLAMAALWMWWQGPKDDGHITIVLSRRAKLSLFIFVGLLLAAFYFADSLLTHFYLVGSLVFGGGHVVLPLIGSFVGEAVPPEQFLLAYSAAQALPGPMFAVASYFGALQSQDQALLFALLATLAIFLPGFLLLIGIQQLWQQLAQQQRLAAAIAGVCAAAVGILAAAWYSMVFSHAPHDGVAIVAVLLGFAALRSKKVPLLVIIAAYCGFGTLYY